MHKRKAIHPPVPKAPTEGPGPTTRGGRPRGRAYLLADARVALRPSKKQRGIAPTQSSILNAIPAHIALVDREGTILAVNDGWRRFADRNGLRIRAFGVGRSYLEVCDRAEGDFAEHARAAAAGLRAVLRGDAREFSLEYPCHSPSERRWFRLMVNGLDGDEVNAVVMHVDLTERKLAEEALSASEQQFSGAFDSAAIGIGLVALDGRLVRVNRALCQMLGYSEDELLSLTFGEITHPEDLAADLEHVRRLLGGEVESYRMEKRYIHHQGHHVWVLLTVSLVRDEAGKPVNFIGQVQDIDGQRQVREAIRTQAQMLDQIGQAVIATDPQGSIIYTNRFAAALYGWPPGGVLGRNILTVTVPEISQTQGAEIMSQLQQGKEWSGEFRVRRQDGTTFLAQVTNSPLLDDDARLIGVIGVSVDISAQKEAERAVLRSEREQRHLVGELETERARLVTAQAVAKVGSWETDLSTMESIWSDEMYRIFEVAPDRTVSHPRFLDEMVHPEDRDAVSAEFTRSMSGDAPGAIEHRIRLPNGGIKVIDERWRVMRNERGVAVYAIGTAHDITDRKRADAHIREQASMLDGATDAIFVLDLDHRITYWNRSAEQLYGWSAAEAGSRPALESLNLHDEVGFRVATERVLATGHWSGELRRRSREGAWLTVESRWTLLRDELGEPRAILAINTDVTERRKLEAEFLRAQRMTGIGTLAGGIAHDLNNLLSPIVMGISVLKRFENNEKTLRVIRNMESSAARGAQLVKQILSFGRGVEGARIPVRLADIATEIEEIVASTFPKNIRFEQHIERDLRLIVGDPTQMSQVVLNLCVNARDAMPAGGRLVVSARNVAIDEELAAVSHGAAPGLYVLLSVSDDGSGMTQDVVDRAFDPFFTTKEIGAGTGLGLSTVAGIVRSHGGFIDVSSEIGLGSTFLIHLPAALDDSGTGTVAQPEAQPPARGRGELILIVDDEGSILSVTSQTLAAFGYRTLVAEDGARALALFAAHRDEIALVITDMMMPVMDGPALIAALQAIDPAVRIVAASGLIESDAVARAAAAGVTHFLAKPFAADAMLSVLADALAATKPPPSTLDLRP